MSTDVSASMAQAFSSVGLSPTLRLALTLGLLGGVTTYSSFNQETIRFIETGT